MPVLNNQPRELEKLERGTNVIDLKAWVILAFFCLIFTAGLIWSFLGQIPLTVEGKCIFITSNTHPKSNKDLTNSLTIYGFVPFSQADEIKSGMEVHVSLDSLDLNKNGMIEGIVAHVSTTPVNLSTSKLSKIPPLILKGYLLKEATPKSLVLIEPKIDSEGQYNWTRDHDTQLNIENGNIGHFRVLVDSIRPIRFIFSSRKKDI